MASQFDVNWSALGTRTTSWKNGDRKYATIVIAAVTMPLTYSIATGIGLGFITYALGKIVSGRFADAKPAVVGLALLFALKFALPG